MPGSFSAARKPMKRRRLDVIFKLRLLIWALLLALWGVLVYQYLGEDEPETAPMHSVVNPYREIQPQPAPLAEERERLAAPEQIPPQARAETITQTPAPPPSSLSEIRVPEEFQGPAAEQPKPPAPAPPEEVLAPVQEAVPAPSGFVKRETRHFTVYGEDDPPSQEFLDLLENLHGNLMLDLAPFSPWSNDTRVSVFLFQRQETYRRVTGRPAWSGAASSFADKRVYIYEGPDLPGMLAHELCHIYYDNFFPKDRSDPLWLSEGMATMIQVERGLSTPNWLRQNLQLVERGGGLSLPELMAVTNTVGMPDAKVYLWYAESYSLVRFLLRSQHRSNFYKFSQFLSEGRTVTESLYRAYGMPYNRLKALEYAWRHQIGPRHFPQPSLARTTP